MSWTQLYIGEGPESQRLNNKTLKKLNVITLGGRFATLLTDRWYQSAASILLGKLN